MTTGQKLLELGRKEGHKEGHKEGRKEGRKEGAETALRQSILEVLEARFGVPAVPLTSPGVARVNDLTRLRELVKAVAVAPDLEAARAAIDQAIRR